MTTNPSNLESSTETVVEESKTKRPHYVDNKKFYDALVEYRNQVLEAERLGNPSPMVSNYIGECFLKIAVHLSYKSNFINYSFKDDMISDGIENCLTAAAKFDPERSANPFAYYTQIIYYAFVRRIQKEKKQQAIKYSLLENIDIDQIISQSEGDENISNQLLELVRKQSDTVDVERKTVKSSTRKKTKKENSLDDLE